MTKEGEVVWEYISPYFAKPKEGRTNTGNMLYRATPVPYDWAPDGTPRSEQAVVPPVLGSYRVAR